MVELNSTTPTLPLHLTLGTTAYWKMNVWTALSASIDAQAAAGGGGGGELDEVKRMLTETNIWLLASTAIVTVLHMLFVSTVINFRADGRSADAGPQL